MCVSVLALCTRRQKWRPSGSTGAASPPWLLRRTTSTWHPPGERCAGHMGHPCATGHMGHPCATGHMGHPCATGILYCVLMGRRHKCTSPMRYVIRSRLHGQRGGGGPKGQPPEHREKPRAFQRNRTHVNEAARSSTKPRSIFRGPPTTCRVVLQEPWQGLLLKWRCACACACVRACACVCGCL